MKYTFRFILLVAVFLFPCSAIAFKAKTHVWIGQQIINDLENDGLLSINLNGQTIDLIVREDIRRAILNNKSDFLMGNIGPDATPDVVVGQTSVHPDDIGKDKYGNVIDSSAWNTDDWLIYLSNQANQSETAKAFVYGYIAHAGADVFAHTYINQYAGDIFRLTDETLVEQRHFILEGYIDAHLPVIVNHLGSALGNAWDLIDLDEAYATFVRDALIFNDTVNKQYWKNPYANHLAAIYNYRQSLHEFAEDPVWHWLDTKVVQIIAYFYDIQLSDEEASQIVDAAQVAIDWVNSEVIDNLQAANNQVYELARKYDDLGYEAVGNAMEEMKQAEAAFINTKQQLESNMLELDSRFRDQGCTFLYEALDIIDPTGGAQYLIDNDPGLSIIDSIFGRPDPPQPSWHYEMSGTRSELLAILEDCKQYEDDGYCNPISAALSLPRCCSRLIFTDLYDLSFKLLPDKYVPVLMDGIQIPVFVEPDEVFTLKYYHDGLWITTSDETILYHASGGYVHFEPEDLGLCYELSDTLDAGHDALIDNIHALEDELIDSKNLLIEKIQNLRNNTLAAADSTKKITDAIVELGQVLNSDVSPVQSLLRNWVLDIDLAMQEYVKAASQVMINTMNPDASALEPIETWFECYYLALLGVPNVVSGCEFRQSIQDLTQAIENILTILEECPIAGVQEYITQLEQLRDMYIEDLKNRIKEEVAAVLEDMIPQEVQDLINLMDIQITDAVLNHYFTIPESVQPPKGLLMIPDIADRVKAEMQISDGILNPDQYAVIRNGIAIAKLALLDSQGLQDLAFMAGAPGSLFENVDNVVAIAFESIDGNHQWMPISPPLPNSFGPPYYPIARSYDSDVGFLLWHESVRDILFRSLFTGPLSPGLDTPEPIGFSPIVDMSYPYNPCSAYPYPDDTYDHTCKAIMLIPISTGLLLN